MMSNIFSKITSIFKRNDKLKWFQPDNDFVDGEYYTMCNNTDLGLCNITRRNRRTFYIRGEDYIDW